MATKQYNIRIHGGIDFNDQPEISFSMDDDTHHFLAEIADYNEITVGEFVAATLMGADFTESKMLN